MCGAERSAAPPPGDLVGAVVGALEELVDASLPPEVVQDLLAAAVRIYARHAERHPPVAAFGDRGPAPTETEVAIAASAMLEAVGVEVFELGLWRAWAGLASREDGHG